MGAEIGSHVLGPNAVERKTEGRSLDAEPLTEGKANASRVYTKSLQH